MSTTPVSSTTSQQILASLARAPAPTTTNSVDDQQTRFLKLLTTQLQNQDPLNPQDSSQMTSQLAEISTVDGVTQLNATLTQLVNSFKSNESLQAASLVGKQVLVDGSHMQLQQGMALGGVDLATAADHVTMTITDANGIQVDSQDLGAMDSGSQVFVWDGSTNNGTPAADGNYTMKVTATLNGAPVTATALQMATVSSIVTEGTDMSVDLGSAGQVSMNDIKRIL